MKQKLYTIWDEILAAHSAPIVALNKGHMIRQIAEWSKNPNHPLTQHPKDKTLFEVGEFDDDHGRIEMYEANKNMGTIAEFQQQEQQG